MSTFSLVRNSMYYRGMNARAGRRETDQCEVHSEPVEQGVGCKRYILRGLGYVSGEEAEPERVQDGCGEGARPCTIAVNCCSYDGRAGILPTHSPA